MFVLVRTPPLTSESRPQPIVIAFKQVVQDATDVFGVEVSFIFKFPQGIFCPVINSPRSSLPGSERIGCSNYSSTPPQIHATPPGLLPGTAVTQWVCAFAFLCTKRKNKKKNLTHHKITYSQGRGDAILQCTAMPSSPSRWVLLPLNKPPPPINQSNLPDPSYLFSLVRPASYPQMKRLPAKLRRCPLLSCSCFCLFMWNQVACGLRLHPDGHSASSGGLTWERRV